MVVHAKTALFVLIFASVSSVFACAASASAGGPPVENDRIQWHFEFNSAFSGAFTNVAEDGSIYATDNLNLYAVNFDGSMQWMLPGAGGGRPIDIASDGTLYTANDTIVAVNPDGTMQWSFTPGGFMVAGPSIGPDGHIYGATDDNGPGAFAIDTLPSLQWTNEGDPVIFSLPGSNWPVVFANGHAVYGITTTAAGGAPVWAFDFDGDQEWFGSDLDTPIAGKPLVDPNGQIITVGGQSVIATAPDGSSIWQTQAPENVSGITTPAIGPDGTIYVVDTVGGERWALSPAGSTQYFTTGEGGFYQAIGISPNGETLLLAGNDIGDPGFVRAYDAADGSPMWQITLDPQGGLNEFVHSSRFSFSPDSQTVYFTTRVGANGNNGRLYAVALNDTIAGDIDGDGVVGVSDLLELLGQWGSCGEPCSGDLDGDDLVGVSDLLTLLGNWG